MTRDERASDPGNLRLVQSIARSVHRKLPPSFDLGDLIAVGNVELLAAAERYDETRSTPFQTFARFSIRGAMLDSCRRRNYIENTRQSINEPVLDRSGKCRSMETDEYFDLEKYGPEGARALFRVATRPAPEDSIDRARMAKRISAAIARLPEEQQRVLAAAFHLDLSIQQIGIRFGIPRGRARKLRADAIGAIRKELLP